MNLRPKLLTLAAMTALASGSAHAMTDAQLREVVDQRLAGDRTGACMAVAVVEDGQVARTFACADPEDAQRIGPDHAFEIGSVSKTMTATLLAQLILEGKASLDDALADYLPEDTQVPQFEGQPILLRHVVTHTSGLPALPSRMQMASPVDPYATLDEAALLGSLADVTLARAPGTQFEYSNFASMVLSYAVARRAGTDLETLLRERLFQPLGMDHAYVSAKPEGVQVATGHLPNTRPTSAWNFQVNLAGVGGVRATLDDMVAYVQGHLDPASPVAQALALTREPVSQQPPMGMNWMLAPVNGRTIHLHEGGTGGFSAFVSIDSERERGVVILSDTTWNSIGSLGSLGLHLVDPAMPLGEPRTVATPDPALLDALAGEYQLAGAMRMHLSRKGDALVIHPAGQGEFEMGHDSAGDFYPLLFDAILRPQRKADGSHAFTWMQMGGVTAATRVGKDGEVEQASQAYTPEQLEAFAGVYPLAPGFELTVRARDGGLHAQATGQGEFPLQAAGKDVFEAAAFGIEIQFQREAEAVTSLQLHQGGQVLKGKRQP